MYLTYAIVLLAALILNLFRVRDHALLNTISAYWHMVGVAIIVIVLFVVPDDHQSFSYVFTETVNNYGLRRRVAPSTFGHRCSGTCSDSAC